MEPFSVVPQEHSAEAGANLAMKGSSLIGIYRIGWEDFPEAPLKGYIIRMGLAGTF